MTNLSKILIVSEKPDQSNRIMPFIQKALPDRNFDVLNLLRIGPFTYKLPRGLSWQDYPIVSNPIYKPDPNFFYSNLVNDTISDKTIILQSWNRENQKFSKISNSFLKESPEDFFAQYEEIIFAAEPWHTEVGAFSTLMNQGKQTGPWRWIKLTDWRNDEIQKSVNYALLEKPDSKNTISSDDSFMKYADTRRYFDFNWVVNATSVFGKTAQLAGANDGLITKYVIMLLQALSQKEKKEFSEIDIINMMMNWSGTGKYSIGLDMNNHQSQIGIPIFGTNASRYALISRLVTMGFIEEKIQDSFSISAVGSNMINMLHPTTYDPDLPFRLHIWSTEEPENSKPKIDKYIKTVFGRQKRYLDKNI